MSEQNQEHDRSQKTEWMNRLDAWAGRHQRTKAFALVLLSSLLGLSVAFQNCSPVNLASAKNSASSDSSSSSLGSSDSTVSTGDEGFVHAMGASGPGASFGYKVAMIGDSITWGCGDLATSVGGDWWRYLGLNNGEVIAEAYPGRTTADALARMPAVISAKPAIIFILLGVNDLNLRRPLVDTQRDYRQILAAIKTQLQTTRVYLQSVLPVNEQQIQATYNLQTKNAEVLQVNEIVKALAVEFGYKYLDLRSVFQMPTGFLRPELTTDGLHLTGEGYNRWGAFIRRNVPELGTWTVANCAAQSPACESTDYVRRDSCGRELDRWAFAPGCESLACEGHDFVRRSGQGQEIARWAIAPAPYCQ